MKKIYFPFYRNAFKAKTLKQVFFLALIMAFTWNYAQQTYTFTNCGITGRLGPNQAQITTAYQLTNLNNNVGVTPTGIQTWTVPQSGLYKITAVGASAGWNGNASRLPGLGASMEGDFMLTGGDVLQILVGQMGQDNTFACAGGGGSFVTKTPHNTLASILVIAGGGGGPSADFPGISATTASCGTFDVPNNSGPAQCAGNGGISFSGNSGGGGGGFFTDGQSFGSVGGTIAQGGEAYVNGGEGGLSNSQPSGGFGGGGGHDNGTGTTACASAGGGFSGGNGGNRTPNRAGGGGGGSYNTGINQVNSIMTTTGHGLVIIKELCNISLTASGSNSLQPSICAGQSVTLTTDGVSNYAWSTGNTTNSVIVVSPAATTVYTLSATSSSNCTASKSITVTVSSGLPVLTITNTPNSICLGKTATLTAGGALTYTWVGGPGGVMNGQTFTPTATSGYTVTGQNGCGQSTASTTITIAPLAVSVASSSNNICAGNTAILTATAAVNGFTWMPGNMTGTNVLVSPTVNTVYTLTASDGTCSGVATLSLDTKPIPTLAVVASATDVCEGAAVTLTVTGANTYTWSTPVSNASIITVNPASATSYVVVGTNGVNCTAAATQIVVTKPNPVVNVSTNKSLVCVDGAATLTASGGSTSYAWINGPATATNVVNPSVSSTYTVTGTGANGCTTDKTITVNVLTVSVSATSASTSICYGSSAVLIASGATTYTWVGFGNFANTTVSPTITTTYSVNANTTSQGLSCPSSNTITITVNALPTVSVSATKTVVCRKDANVVLTADGASTYVWGPAQTTNTISVHPQATITYSVTGTDANGCQGGATLQIVVNPCTGIEEVTGSKTISVYPNPSNGEFTVSCDSDINLKVINELGQLIQTIILNTQNDHKVSVNGLSNGVYFIVGQNQTETVNQKIVVAK